MLISVEDELIRRNVVFEATGVSLLFARDKNLALVVLLEFVRLVPIVLLLVNEPNSCSSLIVSGV